LGPVLLRAGTLVQFRTTFGDIVVEMLDEEKPVTVANFLRYVREGRWRDMISHRVVPGFIVQGGGFAVTNRGTTNVAFVDVPDFGKITNEFGVGGFYSNRYGTIAMAKLGGDPNSASSEWFFNLADNSANLDNQNGGFTVFGRVVAGTNVLNVFNGFTAAATQPTNRLANLIGTGFPFDSRPQPAAFPLLALPAAFAGVFTNLVFLEVSEVRLRAEPLTGEERGLRWNSVVGITNRVEVASGLPPTWRPLTNLVPLEMISTAVDPAANGENVFYRVSVGD
jgi:cyclophilin family peptidyl-prolyl cis-trans isomerase